MLDNADYVLPRRLPGVEVLAPRVKESRSARYVLGFSNAN
jgi:hypothetical protein